MKFYQSMEFKITALAVAGVVLSTVVLDLSVSFSKKETDKIVVNNRTQMEMQNVINMKTIVHGLYNSVLIYDNVLQSKLENGLTSMREKFQAGGDINKIGAAMNFNPKEPSSIVDDVARLHKVYATIFKKEQDGTMTRISTSIVRDGKRFVNTKISPKNEDGTPNAMMQTVLSGHKFVGRANVGGEWVNALYEPIIEKSTVIGMLFVGSLAEDTKNFVEKVRDVEYGKKGSVFAVGSKGAQKGVLSISINGELDGQNVWSLTNSSGENYWQKIIEFGGSLPTGYSDYMEVNYKNKEGQEYKLAIAEMYYAPWDWVIGVTIPKEETEAAGLEMQKSLNESTNSLQYRAIVLGVMMCVLIAIVSFIYANGLTKVIRQTITLFEKIGKGDMTRRLFAQTGEMGIMAKQFNFLIDNLQKFMQKVVEDSSNLASASEELFSLSTQLQDGTEGIVLQSNAVTSTTEQMVVNVNIIAEEADRASTNATEVAGAAEQMSSNMGSIASAMEEMGASIKEIASNTKGVRKIATDATNKAENATEVMSKLGIAAKEIGLVTDVIKKIADKTNLLALNATIEASSAGEAGKGFAVVAGEIKELANQSALSADDITRRIDGIQSETDDAVEVIQKVSDIIAEINESVEDISSHIDQQTKASNEIASNVAQANVGAKRVASAIGEVAKGTGDVKMHANVAANGIANINKSVAKMFEAVQNGEQSTMHVNRKSGDLRKISEELKKILETYKV